MDSLNTKHILSTQFDILLSVPSKKAPFANFVDNTLFTTDGKEWQFHRNLLRPQFARQHIVQFGILEEHMKTLFEVIPGDGTIVDIQKILLDFTLDTCTSLFFGEGVETHHAWGAKFSSAFDACQHHLLIKFFLRSCHWMYNPQSLIDDRKAMFKIVDNFIEEAVKKYGPTAKAARAAAGKSNERGDEREQKKRYVMIEELVQYTEDVELLRGNVIALLIAGRGPPAKTIAFIFHSLVRFPEVQEKLRQEIYKHFGSEFDPSRITFESLKACKYLRWVIDESLRLYPSVPFDARTAVKDTYLPHGGGPDGKSPIFIPKGSAVEFCPYAAHRRIDVFGSDANWFRPERFETLAKDMSRGSEDGAWIYIPFNAGPRSCIGQQMTLTEVSYVTVRLFQQFKNFENGELSQFIKLDMSLNMGIGGNGCQVRCYAK
ncbi:hypothetical protein ABW21_db0205901 [Orbilia brochopaga]|nr:hypothetical protein ABW21_db0205901 [Drechslerella brochopaga]